jgi:hypothetical protein
MSLAPHEGKVDVGSWHECDIARSQMDVRFRGKSGHAADITAMTEVGSRADMRGWGFN